ncbi:MAG: acetolactate decarboxylase [Bacteroidota bacterium]
MSFTQFILVLSVAIFAGCGSPSRTESEETTNTYPDVQIAGAMSNVMWKGELNGIIGLDTISGKKGLYGLGPLSGLQGELLINDGICYVSKVVDDSTIEMQQTCAVSAPFFVYTHVNEWNELRLPPNIKTIRDLETFIDQETINAKRPFVFKLIGRAKSAKIHIQNLPEGAKVSSPAEAHSGQVKYNLYDKQSEVIGFFSTEHQGVFTHHDTYLHMHLISKNGNQMGHLDELEIDEMVLLLPLK